jgi:hypothetical protein
MNSRRFVSLAVATAILAAALPAAAVDGSSEPRLRASIDRALAVLAPPMSAPQAPTHSKASKGTRRSQNGTSTGSGGGGGGHMLLFLLGTAVSVGASIYIVKEMQKQTETPPVPPSFR